MPKNQNPDFDLVIRNGLIATAADQFYCDIGITNGRIVALAESLGHGRQVINAAGKLITPGGVDAHCHMDQPIPGGLKMADDFTSGTLSAACGGTTTVIPFAVQEKGSSLDAAVTDYHRRADGKALIDYAFHLIVTDPVRKSGQLSDVMRGVLPFFAAILTLVVLISLFPSIVLWLPKIVGI